MSESLAISLALEWKIFQRENVREYKNKNKTIRFHRNVRIN